MEKREVVEHEGGRIAVGGAMGLSRADDALIRIERALDSKTEGQLIASALSKKIARGPLMSRSNCPWRRQRKCAPMTPRER